jgi:formate hydrogenlyase subunit 3/multisubunit Na+/H+ antiporter MnhD subunit
MFHAAPAAPVTQVVSALPLLIVVIPMLGAVACAVLSKRGALRDGFAAMVALTVFALALALFPLASRGAVVYNLSAFIGLGLFFRVDFTGIVFTLFVSFIWFLAMLNYSGFARNEAMPARFQVFMLLTLGGCLGVFLTADFFSLFLFFEAMTVCSYVLVIHEQSEEALAAGRKYLFMGIFGGLCLLSGMLVLLNQTGTLAIAPALEQLAGAGENAYLIAILFFIGFGMKAAAVPLHVWMPRAYEFAPSSVNAISSAAMLKAGAYGLIRTFNLLFTPSDIHSGTWWFAENLGYVVIWVGLLTMVTGALLALFQTHAKRLLAFSSISQMGYIITGIGAAAYLGHHGAMGFAGVTYHIMNHAFFKAAMFLMIGAIYLRTGDLSFSRLGGLARSFPVTAAAFLVACLAISGFPGFNGYASKTLLHHAIVEAFGHHQVMSLWAAEKIFVVASGLTFCYILKLFTALFLGPPHPGAGEFAAETRLERLVFGTFAAVILLGGLFPHDVIRQVILPMTAGFSFDSYSVNYVAKTNVFALPDLWGIATSLFIGGAVYASLRRSDFRVTPPNLPLPRLVGIEDWLYQPVLTILLFAYAAVGRLIETVVEGSVVGSIGPSTNAALSVRVIERRLLPWAGESLQKVAARWRDRGHNFVVQKVRGMQVSIRNLEMSVFSTMIKLDYNPRGEQLYRRLTLMNLDVCIIIVLIVLVIAMSIWLIRMTGL